MHFLLKHGLAVFGLRMASQYFSGSVELPPSTPHSTARD
jgi:hypothetical protein